MQLFIAWLLQLATTTTHVVLTVKVVECTDLEEKGKKEERQTTEKLLYLHNGAYLILRVVIKY